MKTTNNKKTTTIKLFNYKRIQELLNTYLIEAISLTDDPNQVIDNIEFTIEQVKTKDTRVCVFTNDIERITTVSITEGKRNDITINRTFTVIGYRAIALTTEVKQYTHN